MWLASKYANLMPLCLSVGGGGSLLMNVMEMGLKGERQEDRSGQQLSFQGGASMNVFPHFLLFCSSKFSFMSLFYHGKKAQFAKIL